MSELMKLMKRIEPVGSRVTCEPPPEDSDADFLVLVAEEDFDDFTSLLEDGGWELGGSVVAPAEFDVSAYSTAGYGFNSYTKEMECGTVYNFIITCSEEFFDKFMAATAEAKALNLLKKEERVALFQKVLYGNEHYLEQYSETFEGLEEF